MREDRFGSRKHGGTSTALATAWGGARVPGGADAARQRVSASVARRGRVRRGSQAEASSVKDMGQVMSFLKSNYAGQMDFSAASQEVKAALMSRNQGK